jgi:hypothetical protein
VSKVILFFYEKENLPLERSECANPPSKKRYFTNELHTIVVYLTSLGVIWAFFGMSETRVLKVHECQKKAQITQERVEYNVFLFDESPKGSKSLKIFKISLTFRFDKLSNLSKSVHIGENSQILTVSNKKIFLPPLSLDNNFFDILKI